MSSAISRYVHTTRNPWVAFILVFPVYFLYQLGLALTPGIRNGADLITDALLLLRQWEPTALFVVAAVLVLAYGLVLARLKRDRKFSGALFGLVAVEGAVHGVLMFVIVNRILGALLLGQGPETNYPFYIDVILSLGAGFHEELVFRVLLFGGLLWLGSRAGRKPSVAALVMAMVVSSLLFSGIHYIGPLGDPLQLGSFLFRFFAGCYFAAVYYWRGFAVAVYAHAIYDIGIFAVT
jgi:hypothetical protein